jgi:hypothetical protein
MLQPGNRSLIAPAPRFFVLLAGNSYDPDVLHYAPTALLLLWEGLAGHKIRTGEESVLILNRPFILISDPNDSENR